MLKTYEINKTIFEQIEEQRKKTKNNKEDKRLNAIELIAQGKKNIEIADKLDVSKETVSRWISKFKNNGVEGLLNRKRIANHKNLPFEEEEEFLRKYEEKAKNGNLISIKEIDN